MAIIKVSDFVANFLADAGITDVFMLTGGGAMHLNNSLGKHPKLKVTFNHHEQASAMAAESYARLTNKMAVVNVTTGPGGINTLNGVFGAWTDSIPMFVISGQVRYDTTIHSTGFNIRQLGDQEVDIVSCVKPITKYADMVIDPQLIKYQLQKALFIATHGRPGPVWLDIPMNVQGANVDDTKLVEFNPEIYFPKVPVIQNKSIQHILERIAKAARPVILAGSGVRLSRHHDLFLKLIDKLQIPVTTAWNAHDVLYNDHPLYVGRPGSVGDRPGNFAVQNSDLLLVLGCRVNVRQMSYNWKAFAREAFKIVVDIDPLELIKPTLPIDMPIQGSVQDFMEKMLVEMDRVNIPSKKTWIDWCIERKNRYPVVLKEYWDVDNIVNPYCFVQALGDALPEDEIIVSGDGTACVTTFQAIHLKKGQRIYTNSGSASMGYDLPAAIGACVASKGKRVICLAGDGSIQQNIQELAVIAYHKYPIKIFVLNNNGYHSIRQTQTNFFGQPYVGVGPESGLGFPEFEKIAYAYGLPYIRCERHADLKQSIADMIHSDGPMICEVMLTLEQQFAPKASSKRLADGRLVTRPLEDLAPFLSKEELAENMLIAILPEE
jgi:acetolactate synthase-1/2/3 large subunit